MVTESFSKRGGVTCTLDTVHAVAEGVEGLRRAEAGAASRGGWVGLEGEPGCMWGAQTSVL